MITRYEYEQSNLRLALWNWNRKQLYYGVMTTMPSAGLQCLYEISNVIGICINNTQVIKVDISHLCVHVYSVFSQFWFIAILDRWCRMLRPGKMASAVLVVLKDVSDRDFHEHKDCFPFLDGTFSEVGGECFFVFVENVLSFFSSFFLGGGGVGIASAFFPKLEAVCSTSVCFYWSVVQMWCIHRLISLLMHVMAL